jgi:hypothetical protein
LHGEGGITSDSILNELKGFHTSNGFPPCIGHDCFQGKFKEDLENVLEYLIKKMGISTKYIIKKLEFLRKNFKESYIVINQKTNKMSGTMTQVKNTILSLPFLLLGTSIQGTDMQKFCNIIVEITRFLLARSISESQIENIRKTIEKYFDLKKKLFPEKTFTAKDHYITHYPDFVKFYGPLRFTWTLDFEQFHQNFKYIQYRTKNFKNPLKTLATNFQISQILREKVFNQILEPQNIQISDVKFGNFVFSSTNINYYGQQFKINDIILYAFNKDDRSVELLKIALILINKSYDDVMFVGSTMLFKYDTSTALHVLHETNIRLD